MLEELSEFEMELPARCRPPLCINLVEPIPDIHSQRSEWTQGRNSEAETAEKTGRIELPRFIPDVAALKKAVHVQRLIDPQPDLAGANEECIAERRSAGLGVVGVRIESAWSDREFVVAAQLLSAPDRERLRIKEWSGIAKQRAGAGRETDHEHHWLSAENAAADVTDRGV